METKADCLRSEIEKVSRVFIALDKDIQELVTDERGMVSKELALIHLRRRKKEIEEAIITRYKEELKVLESKGI